MSDATGTLKFTGAGGGRVDGKIGNAVKALELIEVATDTDANAVNLGNGNAVKATTLRINSANATVAEQTVAQIKGEFTGNVNFSSDNHDGGTLELNGADAKITGNITTGNNKKGKILVNDDAAITGDIGAEGSALKDVKVNSAHILTLSGALNKATNKHYAETFTFSADDAQITVADKGELHAEKFVSTGARQGKIVFVKNGTIEGTIGAKNNVIKLVEAGNAADADAAGVVTVGAGDHYVAKFNIGGAVSSFKFKDGANINGAISTSEANQGSLEFEGTSTVNGKVGEAKAFKTITVLGEEGKIVDFQGDVAANTLEINHKGTAKLKAGFTGELKLNNDSGTRTRDDDPKKDSRVVLHGNTAHVLDGKITTNGKAPMGVIEIDSSVAGNSVTFKGAIGDIESDSAIALIQANQGFTGTLDFWGDSDVTKLEIASASKIKLNEGKEYKFGSISTRSDELVLNVVAANNHRVTLVGSSDARVQIGTADKKLGSIQFDDENSILEVGENIDIAVNKISYTLNKGILEFKGNNILIGDTGSVNKVDVFGGANKPVRLKGKVVANGGMTINDSAVLEIEQDQASEIKAKANGNGTLRILNENGAIKITKKVGDGNALGTVEFAGQSVEFKESVSSNNFKFSGDSVKEVIFTKNADIATSDFENNSNAIHTVIVPEVNDITFAGKFKEGSNQIKFQIQEDKTTKVASSFGGAIFTTKDNRKGKLV